MDPHHLDAAPDSTYRPDADPDPTFHPDANPDPHPCFKKNLLLLLWQTDCMGTNRKIVSRMIEEFQHPAIQAKECST